MTEQSTGRLKTILLSASEVLEDIAVQSTREDALGETLQQLDLFLLQMREELRRWRGAESDR